MNGPLISARDLTYTYPESATPALRDISLDVASGEFVLLAGRSGAGKSTLLRCLNGLVPHFSGGRLAGRLRVAGLDPAADGPHILSQKVGFVFQEPEAQLIMDDVAGELRFGLESHAVPAAEMGLRIDEALGMVGLQGQEGRPVASLSGGERQRLAIATVLVLRPPMLVLDEPTSQLDPSGAEEVLQTLVRLNEEFGLTIVLAEHRLERVVRHADRLLFLEGGRLVANGPIQETLPALPRELMPPLARLATSWGWTPIPLNTGAARDLLGGVNGASANAGTPPVVPAGDAVQPAIAAADLHYSYDGRPALRGVSLSVRPGEAVALLGRNGAGKSTLLKLMTGLLAPAQGEVTLLGRPVHGREPSEIGREVGYLPQTPDDLLFAETVSEELLFTLHSRGQKKDASEAAEALLDDLDVAKYAGRYPRDLSAGERQRVAFGAIAAGRPAVLLLDEPTRGLDYHTKSRLITLWRAWLARGAALLIATHDVELAARLADRVVVLGDGRVVAAGPVHEVLSGSALFAPQVARLLPGRGWLTVEEVLAHWPAAEQDRD